MYLSRITQGSVPAYRKYAERSKIVNETYMNHLFSLEGKRAVIMGGAVNIGRALSKSLAAAGAETAVVYRSSKAKAESCIAEITAEGGKARGFQCDISSEASVIELYQRIQESMGSPDIVVNNSGILSLSSQSELSVEQWDKIFSVNARGVFLSCREAAKRMNAGSRLINIASINALHPGFGGSAHYDATKGAVAAYSRSLAAELGPKGIRVNAVAPGLIDTEEMRSRAGELAKEVEKRSPSGRLSKAEDIAAAVLFLASRAAENINGEILIVDGGYLLS